MRMYWIVLTLLTLSCTHSTKENEKVVHEITQAVDTTTPIQPGFDLQLDLLQESQDTYSLSAFLTLDSGSYVISPLSDDDFYLSFDIAIPLSTYMTVDKGINENPSTIAEFDSIIEKNVRFVRQNTTFSRNLSLVSTEDFELPGQIQFLLEPQCIPYDVDFSLVHEGGVLRIENLKTKINSSYKM